MFVAFVSFVLRWIADATCSPYSTVCKKSSDFLSHIYAVVVFFLVFVAVTKAKQVRELFQKIRAAVQLLMSDGKEKKD